jgi:hypothetical protein
LFDFFVVTFSETKCHSLCFVICFNHPFSVHTGDVFSYLGFGVCPDKRLYRRPFNGRRIYKQYACLSLKG